MQFARLQNYRLGCFGIMIMKLTVYGTIRVSMRYAIFQDDLATSLLLSLSLPLSLLPTPSLSESSILNKSLAFYRISSHSTCRTVKSLAVTWAVTICLAFKYFVSLRFRSDRHGTLFSASALFVERFSFSGTDLHRTAHLFVVYFYDTQYLWSKY